MKNPVMVIPEAWQAMVALNKAYSGKGISPQLIELVQLRVSQINGCGLCVDMHARLLKKHGESDERLFSVAAWRDTPFFTEAERAALALAESLCRIADRGDAVPDDLWQEATRHYDERAISALLLSISAINVWNRLNVATRQLAGSVPLPER